MLVWRVVRGCHGGDPETRSLLAADVVGFSKLAGSDEERTLARLRALRSDLIDPTIAVHNGRIVKRTGDGVLIEFRSVVDAVRRLGRPWPDAGGLAVSRGRRSRAIKRRITASRCSSPVLSWRRSVTALRHG